MSGAVQPASSIRCLISGTAAAASGRLTVIRTISDPASASSTHCCAVPARVGGVGHRHRLHDDRRAAADLNGGDLAADSDADGLVKSHAGSCVGMISHDSIRKREDLPMNDPSRVVDWPPPRRPAPEPRRPDRRSPSLAAIVFGGGTALSYYVESLWFDSLGYVDVFWKTLNVQAAVFCGFAAVTFLVLYGSFVALKPRAARRARPACRF